METPTHPGPQSAPPAPGRAERIEAALPLVHGASVSSTRNISATGVLFSTDEDTEIGSTVSFTVEITIDGKKLNLVCEGQVVRAERQEGKTLIAAKVSDSFLETP